MPMRMHHLHAVALRFPCDKNEINSIFNVKNNEFSVCYIFVAFWRCFFQILDTATYDMTLQSYVIFIFLHCENNTRYFHYVIDIRNISIIHWRKWKVKEQETVPARPQEENEQRKRRETDPQKICLTNNSSISRRDPIRPIHIERSYNCINCHCKTAPPFSFSSIITVFTNTIPLVGLPPLRKMVYD